MRFSRTLLSLSIGLSSTPVIAQPKMNVTAKNFVRDYALQSAEKPSAKFITDYDVTKINGEYNIGVLALVNEQILDINALNTLGVLNDSKIQQIRTFRVPLARFNDFLQVSGIQYFEIGSPVSTDLELSVPSARVDSVHQGLGGLSQAYSGKGVVVAVIDWGFDYTHPNFYDTTLSDLRIVRAWDQNKLSGPAPQGYSFGTEYLDKNALLAAEQDTLYVFGPSSHGTHVAGIAAGNGAGTVHGGAAPDAELILISLRRDSPSLIDAYTYIANHAAAAGKPFVVNMSFGAHLGAHDGVSLENMVMDVIQGPGKIYVASAGNNGTSTDNFHLKYDFTQNQNDTVTTVVNFATGLTDVFGQAVPVWGSANSSFAVSVAIADNFNTIHYQSPYYHSNLEPELIDTIVFGGSNTDTLILRIQSIASHFLTGKPNILVEVKKTTANHKVILKTTSVNSDIHMWNVVRMNNRYTNWGVPFSSAFPLAMSGDNNYGIGEPGAVGQSVITVGSYRAERFNVSGTMSFGNISGFSSLGPTVDERVKPEISSTGEAVLSSVNSFNTGEGGVVLQFQHNGRTYGFKSYSGTSMSGPMVAGIIALMLEANPKLSAAQAKEILKTTARLDNFTGAIDPQIGHLKWGWGKANALAAVKAAEILASSEHILLSDNLFHLYPNPSSDFIRIKSENQTETIESVEIINMEGKTVKLVSGINSTECMVDINTISNGFYLVKVQSNRSFQLKQFVKQ